MKKKSLLHISSLLSLTLLAACGNTSGQANQNAAETSEAETSEAVGSEETTSQTQGIDDQATVNVVTSFYPVYEFAREVAGDRANIDVMVSGSQDAHSYEPSAQDIAKVSEADVFLYSSDEMEYWAGDVLTNVDHDELVVGRLADGMDDHAHDHGENHDHEEADHSHDPASEEGNLEVIGISGHYHTGDVATLQAEPRDEANTVVWYVASHEEDAEFQEVEGYNNSVEIELDEEKVVRADEVDENGEVVETSGEIHLHIDDHEGGDTHGDHADHNHSHDEEDHDHDDHEHHAEDSQGNLEIVGLSEHYHSGDVAALQADPKDENNTLVWYVASHDEDADFQEVDSEDNRVEIELDEEKVVRVDEVDESGEVVETSGEIHLHIDDHDVSDPHIWLDLVSAQDQVDEVVEALVQVDPEGEEYYTQNAQDFKDQLQALHEEYESQLADADQRAFIVQHEAFGHLANRYELEQISVGGISTEVEPSPARIAEISEIVNEYDLPVIYYQSGANSDIAQTIAAETGAEPEHLFDLESRTPEMEEAGMGYLEAMQENLSQLQKSIH